VLPVLPVLPKVADLLVVDDSAVARAKLRRLFAGAGYEVHLAQDGVEALALLGAGQYTLMVTDLEMPRMDGIALIKACSRRAQISRMPIIAVSAHENLRAMFNECRDIAGVHPKPWFDDVLLSHVAALIGARTPASSNEPERASSGLTGQGPRLAWMPRQGSGRALS
jgi:CheY-like chemotaxis protein